jgi:hypothetical protein
MDSAVPRTSWQPSITAAPDCLGLPNANYTFKIRALKSFF